MSPTFARDETLEINVFAYFLLPPKRWDVVTYIVPNREWFWTQRVVGIPGDTIAYDKNKVLYINGAPASLTLVETNIRTELPGEKIFIESIEGSHHLIQLSERAPALLTAAIEDFAGKDLCTFSQGGISCVIPAYHFFVMGDNRDNSHDSRYFGFVPEVNIVGRVENAPIRPFRP